MATENPTIETSDARWNVRTCLRSDLRISRQVTRGKVIYVIHDPVSFRAHRLSLREYEIAGALRESRTLRQVFEECIKRELLGSDDQEEFFRFLSLLESSGF